MMWLMTLNAFTMGKFDLSLGMKMVGYRVQFVNDGLMKHVWTVGRR